MKNIKKLGRLLTVLTLSIILAISASNILADHVETDTTIKEDKLIEETNTLTQESVDQESDELDLNSEETKTKNNLQSDSDELNDINKLQSNQPDDINIQADEAVTGGEFGNTTWEFVDGTLTVSPIPNTDGKMGASDILNVYFSNRPFSNEITHIEIEPGVQLNDNVSDWNTSKVESMAAMFENAKSLETLDVSKWDTSNVKDMQTMFYSTNLLETLDVSNWDTSSVVSMKNMFVTSTSLIELDVSNWDTSSVVSMESMFAGATSLLELDVSNWDVSKVESMPKMFVSASSLKALDLGGWDVSNVTDVFVN